MTSSSCCIWRRSWRTWRQVALVFFSLAPALVRADVADLTVASATKGSSNVPVPMRFPLTRSGDLGYDVVFGYRTVDGTALAGTDYLATAGTSLLAAGTASATVPVVVNPNVGTSSEVTFQLQIDGAAGVGPAPSFATALDFAAGTAPVCVIAADLNGDGAREMIAANSGSNNVSVLRNTTAAGTPSPSFATQQLFSVGTSPTSVAAADINGDGKTDLIVANFGSSTISVLRNTTAAGASTLSFAAQRTFTTGNGPRAVKAVDVNGDGVADLVVANAGDSTVSVLINTSAPGTTMPSFATQQAFAAGSGVRAVAIADINNDGMPDIVGGNAGAGSISVLRNITTPGASTPSFSAQQIFTVGSSPYAVEAGDVDGDGKIDLSIANHADGTVTLLVNTTAPGASAVSFATAGQFGAGTSPGAVALADSSGDGKLDLFVAYEGDAVIAALRNTSVPGSNAGFLAGATLNAGMNPVSIAAADLNGDGKAELLTANSGSNTLSVLPATTPLPGVVMANLAASQAAQAGSLPRSVVAADFNGDGRMDLMVANFCTGTCAGTVSALLGTTMPGSSTVIFAARQTFPAGSSPYALAAADFNGDGKADIAVTNIGLSGNTVSVLLNTTVTGSTTLSFTGKQAFLTGANPHSVAVGDVNGDGKPDLVVGNFQGNSVSVLRNATAPGAVTANFASPQDFSCGTAPQAVAVDDINGDGRPDLITANSTADTVSVLMNTSAPGATSLAFAGQVAFATGGSPNGVIAIDLNGDGKRDLVTANFAANTQPGNTLSVLRNTTAAGASTPSFAAQQIFATDLGPLAVAPADIDVDGRADLVVGQITAYSVAVRLNTTIPGDNTLVFAAPMNFDVGGEARGVVAVDVNGDGKVDPVTAIYSGNAVGVLLDTLHQVGVMGSPATGTIVHDYLFANGFE